MDEEGLREGGSPVVVYLHGLDEDFDWWYCIDVPVTKDPLLTKDNDNSGQPIALPMKNISPVAKLDPIIYGSAGNWAVIGDDIYYAGGSLLDGLCGSIPNEKLVKHSVTHSDPAFWQIESSLNCPRRSPVVAAVGREKLCVVGGKHCTCHDRPKFGEIYDIKEKTWKFLDDYFDAFAPYDPFSEVAISVEKDEPTQIVFYSLLKGCIMIYDPTKGTISKLIEDQKDFALRSHSWDPSPGLIGLIGNEDKILALERASNTLNAVFTNDTFYWFTFDMYMYAYHVSAKRWFQSPCLVDQFPSLSSHDHPPPSPILVGLPQDGKFVVFLPEEPEPGLMMTACLKVERNLKSLQVLVELIQPLSLEETYFLPFEGKAMLKNTGSISMHG